MTVELIVPLLVLATVVSPEDRVDKFMKAAIDSIHIPGASLIVLQDGKIVKESAYGLANIEYNVPAKPETLYLLASITKSFTATGIMLLVEEGKIHLDDSISTYLTDAPDAWKPITVRMLLGHTGGLKDRWEEKDNSLWRIAYSTTDLYNAAKATPLDFAPGTHWQYSDQGYFLLGRIIEKVSGKSYRQFLTERIFKPCGMETSTTTSQTEIVSNLAQGYTQSNGKWAKNHRRTDYGLVSHFGIVSNVMDLAKFDQALMDGKLLKPETLQQMWTPTKIANGDVGHRMTATYGMGWFLEEINGHRIVEHGGASGTGYLKYPDDKLTIIVLTNLEQLAGGDGIGLGKVVAQAYVKGVTYSDAVGKPDPDPQLGRTVMNELAALASGKMTSDLYTPEYAKQIEPTLPSQKAGLSPLGPVEQMEFLSEQKLGLMRRVTYRAHFKNFPAILELGLTPDGKIEQMFVSGDTKLDD
jgi:CubicO group peptidase (beta-lactamase class C family)